MLTIDQYNEWKKSQGNDQQTAAIAGVKLSNASSITPDQAASDYKLGRSLGLPKGVAAEGRETFMQRLQARKNETILKSNPLLAAWLGIGENVEYAQDDLDQLSGLERGLGAAGRAMGRGVRRITAAPDYIGGQINAGLARDIGKTREDIHAEILAELGPDASDREKGRALVEAQKRFIAIEDLTEEDRQLYTKKAAEQFSSAQAIMDRVASIPMSDSAEGFKNGALAEAENSITGTLAAFVKDPIGGAAFILETGAESLPSLAAASIVTAATRSPAAGAAIMGATSALTENHSEALEFLSEKGIDLSSPEAAQAILENPDLLSEANQRGLLRGLVIGVFDGVSGGLAGQALLKSPAGDAIAQGLAQAAMGSAGEFSAQSALDDEIDWKEVTIEGLAEFATAPIEAVGVGRRFAKDKRRAKAAQDTQDQLDRIVEASKKSKLRERLPEKFAEFVNQATEGKDVSDIYVPAKKLEEFFQSYDVSPDEFIADLNDVSLDDFETALTTGGDVKIPTGTYAAYIVGTEMDAGLREHMRFHPDDMTIVEAQAFNENVQEIMEEAYQEAEAMRIRNLELRETEDRILDEMTSRLRAAGRAPDVARSEAMIYPAFYRAMAKRSNMTTSELLTMFPLPSIRGAIPEGLQRKDMDDLKRNLIALKHRKDKAPQGQTLLEFIDERGGIYDEGGELDVRDAAIVKRGKGKKNLRLKREGKGSGYGFDDVAKAAIEAGYMADHPVILDYQAAMAEGRENPDIIPPLLEAIDAELRGEVDHAAGHNVGLSDAMLDEMEAYLNEMGLSIEDDIDVLQAALTDAEEGQMYAQARGKERPLFKRDGDDIRGSIIIPAGGVGRGETIINLFEKSNLSTFLHETGHYFLSVAEALANSPDATPEIRGMHNSIKSWWRDNAKDVALDANRAKVGQGYAQSNESKSGRDAVAKLNVNEDLKPIVLNDLEDISNHQSARASVKRGAVENRSGQAVNISGNNVSKWYSKNANARKRALAPHMATLFEQSVLYNDEDPSNHYAVSHLILDGEHIAVRFIINKTPGRADGLYQIEGIKVAPISVRPSKGLATESAGATKTRSFKVAELVETFNRHGSAYPFFQREMDSPDGVAVEVKEADVLEYLDKGSSGSGHKDVLIQIGLQEQFARMSEAYFLGGKAPSHELRSAFEKFRAWLLSIYQRVKSLNVNITPEISSVMDRMLAVDEEIKDAQEDFGEVLWESAEAAGLSEAEYKSLLKLHAQAQDEAHAKMLKEAMAPIKREHEKWFKEEKTKARAGVEKHINASPVYRAIEWMGNKRWFGEDAPDNLPEIRLHRGELVRRYGEGILKTLPRGKFAVYSESGLDLDMAAEFFGFSSGDEMVRAMEQAPKRKEAIEAEVDRVMFELHGDALRDGRAEEEAIKAVHGDKRGQLLASELRVLNEMAGYADQTMSAQQAREAARQTISKMKVRDAVASHRFLAAERRAANDLIKLSRQQERERMRAHDARRGVGKTARKSITDQDGGGLGRVNKAVDAANATTSKANDAAVKMADLARKRLLNHMLYSESLKIEHEVVAAEKLAKRLSRRTVRDKLAGDYLDAIDDLLQRYDFRKLSGREEDRRGALLVYVERMIEDGREAELSIPESVLQTAKRQPYKAVSVEHLRGVVDSLKNIEHTARMKRKLLDAKSKRDLDEVVSQIKASFEANISGKEPERSKAARSKVKEGVSQYINLVKNTDTTLREIDGFNDFGAAYENIKAPIDAAMNDLIIERKEAALKFEELYSVYDKKERRAMAELRHVDYLGGQFSKWDLISIALNTGNEDNFQRLTDSRVKGAFSEAQVTMALASLDERDAKFVQSVWDFINSYWPQIEAREKRVTGVAPKKTEARQIEIGGVLLKGGYYPLKYDAGLSSLANDDAASDVTKAIQAGRFGKAQTRNGHLKERANSSGRPVLIDIGVLHGHINQVIHDLALSEAANASWKILQDRRIRDLFLENGRSEDHKALEIWVQDVAAGEMRSADIFNKLARRAKSGFTVSKLAFNLSTVLLQPTGIAQSMTIVGKGAFVRGVTDMFRYSSNPFSSINEAAKEVMTTSPFMAERESTFNKDIYDVLGDTKDGPVASRIVNDKFVAAGFWLMQKTQFYLVDLPTWFAAHRNAVKAGHTENDAIKAADRAVARAQASGLFSDRSAIERGSISQTTRQSDVVRLFTALGSYMFAKFNVAYESTAKADFSNPRAVFAWTTDMAMLFALEGLLYAAIKGRLPDSEDEDDEGWAEFLAKETAFSALGTLPFIRDFASALQGFSGGGAYGGVMDILAAPFTQAAQGEIDKALFKSMVNAGGFALMLPSSQVNRFVDATWEQADGANMTPAEFALRAGLGVKPDP